MAEKKKRVNFSVYAPEAKSVYLVGSFNGWSLDADPMKEGNNGTWKKTKYLKPDTYEYKFVVDGVWMEDPECDERVAGAYGTPNSIIRLSA
jgi:1,4-alpha-glucan branching enzyme